MLNGLLVLVVLGSILLAAWTGRMEQLTLSVVTGAKQAVTTCIGLVGVMAFFLGLVRIVEKGGLLREIARGAAPLMRRLFPSIPPEHPAMSAMVLNIASNMMGLANAATPFGIKAMEELNKLNARKGTATDAMVLFLAINTSGLALLPTSVIAVRAALGSGDPAGIVFPTWFAGGCATVTGILAATFLARLPRFRTTPSASLEEAAELTEANAAETEGGDATPDAAVPRATRGRRIAVSLFWLAFAALMVRQAWLAGGERPPGEVARELVSYWLLPALVAAPVLFGWARRVRVYDALVEGGREGFQVALRIFPYMVAILVAVGMFRASGGIDWLVHRLAPVTEWIGLPAEALPMAFLRPLTGSGSLAVMTEIMTVHGPDSFLGYMVSTLQGSTETTFYILAVYYGAVGIRQTRHTLPACLLADAAGLLGAVLIVNRIYG